MGLLFANSTAQALVKSLVELTILQACWIPDGLGFFQPLLRASGAAGPAIAWAPARQTGTTVDSKALQRESM